MCPWSASRGHSTSDSVTVYKAKIATPDLMKENKDVLGILSYVLNTGQWSHSVLFNRTANVNVTIFIWGNFVWISPGKIMVTKLLYFSS